MNTSACADCCAPPSCQIIFQKAFSGVVVNAAQQYNHPPGSRDLYAKATYTNDGVTYDRKGPLQFFQTEKETYKNGCERQRHIVDPCSAFGWGEWDQYCGGTLSVRELLNPAPMTIYAPCFKIGSYGGFGDAGYLYTNNQRQVFSSAYRFGIRGCHTGCIKIKPLVDTLKILGPDLTHDLVAYNVVDIITTGKGTSLSFGDNITGDGPLWFEVETNIYGRVVSHSAGGSGEVKQLQSTNLGGINIGLKQPFNQRAQWIYDTTEESDEIIIDTSVPSDCPKAMRYTDWVTVPVPPMTEASRTFIRFLLDQVYFEECDGAISLPCAEEESSLLGGASMTMAMTPPTSFSGDTGGGSLMETAGPPLWFDLHTTAEAGLLTPEWLAEFALRIPCPICRSHWLNMLKDHPPRYDDQYAWSVEVHNIVNARLGKPIWTGA